MATPLIVRGREVELVRHPGEGPPLLLVHGAGSNARAWDPVARALGIPYLTPAPREIAGLSSVGAPTDSALVEFDFGIDPPPGLKAIPPVDGTPVHEAVRRLDATQAQLDAFFRPDGSVIQTCDGVCDPE